jgi:hypothetical protein
MAVLCKNLIQEIDGALKDDFKWDIPFGELDFKLISPGFITFYGVVFSLKRKFLRSILLPLEQKAVGRIPTGVPLFYLILASNFFVLLAFQLYLYLKV